MTTLKKASRMSLGELALLKREINQLFERLAEFDRGEPRTAGEWSPSVDVYECHGKLMVVAEVPGLAPESLRVVCGDHRLAISGERRERRERRPAGGAAAFLCVERPQGRFTRVIPLDVALDARQAEARLAGGLLTITIPRLKDRRGRETVITVQKEPAS